MKKLLILSVLSFMAVAAFGQASTNLSVQMQTVWTNFPVSIQQSTLDTWADYTKAVNRSPEFKGVATNVVVTITDGKTNTVTTVTTNHSPMTFVQWFQEGITQAGVAQMVERRNYTIRQEMYRKVGKTVVDSW